MYCEASLGYIMTFSNRAILGDPQSTLAPPPNNFYKTFGYNVIQNNKLTMFWPQFER